MRKYFICLVIPFIAMACERESSLADPAILGIDYFPLMEGSFAIYDVEEVEYTVVGEEIHSNYQLMIETSTPFQNEKGEGIYTINRYVRESEAESWDLVAVWSAQRNNHRAVATEENVAYQKLSFPVGDEITWDGNALNILELEQYSYNLVGEPFTTDDGTIYDSTVTVVHNDLLDKIVMTDYRIEVYAKDIGLLFKESNLINYCTDSDCLGQEIIETGRLYRQSLIEYGKN